MTALALAVFMASLAGSPHCAGMCGPFCCVAVAGRGARVWLLHAAYHGGRLATYAVLGAAAGAAGAIVDLASTLAGLQPIALSLAGVAMVLVGAAELARARGWRTPTLWEDGVPWAALLRRGHRFAASRSGVPRALAIGSLTTLLPCGWLYAFVVTAAGSGSPLAGAAVMGAFWVGTLPVLLSLSVGVRGAAGLLGDRLKPITALVLVAVGLLTLSGRLAISPEAIAATLAQEANGRAVSAPPPHAVPPCCRAAREMSP